MVVREACREARRPGNEEDGEDDIGGDGALMMIILLI
jgi:hypothetical protein